MTRTVNIFLTAFLLACLVAPMLSATVTPKLLGDDDEIYDQVNRKLNNDADIHGRLKIEVKDGVVTLSGLVGTDKVRVKAEKIAKKVSGVKQVVNKIDVGSDKPPK